MEMTDISDSDLLAQFARNGSEPAFAELVDRHLALVHSTAQRHTANPQHAQDIAQAVFIILARKAGTLGHKTILAAWLYLAARLTAANFRRSEARRIRREQAAFMESTLTQTAPDSVWHELAPQLDEAISHLGTTDRDALVLRYFQNKSLSEVGAALGVEERAAQKRVARAVEKLRAFFVKRGVLTSTAVLTAMISAHSVQAAPAALAKTITAAAITKGVAVNGSTTALIKAGLKATAWTKMKLVMVIGLGVLFAAATTAITVNEIQQQKTYPWQVKIYDRRVLEQAPPQVRILPAKHSLVGGGWGISNGKIMGLGMPVKHVIQAAYAPTYGTKQISRITATTELPAGRYDMIASLSAGNALALQEEVARKFGLRAKLETRATDVLLLTVKSLNAPGLKPGTQSGSNYSNQRGKLQISGADMGSLRLYLDEYFQIPVMDRTGLTGNFDVAATWDEPVGGHNPDALKEALINQLGLELVPGREPVEMLVVEKVK